MYSDLVATYPTTGGFNILPSEILCTFQALGVASLDGLGELKFYLQEQGMIEDTIKES